MESAGARLKKIRLEKGITLEDAHKKTKINLNILKALEEDQYINFSPIYIKGFLKIYTKFLGVAFEDFIPEEKKPQSQILPKPQEEAKEKIPSFFEGFSGKFNPFRRNPPGFKPGMNAREEISASGRGPRTLVPAGSAFFKPRIKPKTVIILVLLLVFVISLFNLGRVISSRRSSSLLSSENKAKDVKAAVSKVAEGKSKSAKISVLSPENAQNKKAQSLTEANKNQGLAQKAAQVEAMPKEEAKSGIMLVIRAKEDCWVQLKLDGHVVFQSTLKKGRAESWQAKDKIELSLGNAGVIDLEVNGKLISGLGRKGQALKNILITKEGLTIG